MCKWERQIIGCVGCDRSSERPPLRIIIQNNTTSEKEGLRFWRVYIYRSRGPTITKHLAAAFSSSIITSDTLLILRSQNHIFFCKYKARLRSQHWEIRTNCLHNIHVFPLDTLSTVAALYIPKYLDRDRSEKLILITLALETEPNRIPHPQQTANMHNTNCPKCGTAFSGSSKTCGSCGAVSVASYD